MSAQENQILFFGKVFRHSLVKDAALWSQVDHARSVADFFLDGLVSEVDRLCLHQHTCAAAVRIIIDFLVFVERIIADVDGFHRKIA